MRSAISIACVLGVKRKVFSIGIDVDGDRLQTLTPVKETNAADVPRGTKALVLSRPGPKLSTFLTRCSRASKMMSTGTGIPSHPSWLTFRKLMDLRKGFVYGPGRWPRKAQLQQHLDLLFLVLFRRLVVKIRIKLLQARIMLPSFGHSIHQRRP